MFEEFYATGEEIYEAAVEGSKRGFNRSRSDLSEYKEMLRDLYNYMLSGVSMSDRKSIKKLTKNSWRLTYLPLSFLRYHDHIRGEPSERHVRVMLRGNNVSIIDITLESWEKIEMSSMKLLATHEVG